jgi:hypothetical protein
MLHLINSNERNLYHTFWETAVWKPTVLVMIVSKNLLLISMNFPCKLITLYFSGFLIVDNRTSMKHVDHRSLFKCVVPDI